MIPFSVRWLVLAGLCVTLAGCVLTQPLDEQDKRSQRDKDLDVGLIGDVTDVANVVPIQAYGVGLVTGLDGTGDCPPGDHRKMLENELRKRKIENVKALLDSPDNAIVIVTANIPAGVRKGDRLDVEITLPQGSKTTSLQGGYLHECPLRNYESTQSGMHEGHVLGSAAGPLLVGFGNPNDASEMRAGRIWDGGAANIDRPFGLILKNDSKFARIANQVADRINLQYHDSNQERARIAAQKRLLVLDEMTQKINAQHPARAVDREMAKALNKDSVVIDVPYEYRFNPARYLRVVRLTPLQNLGPQQVKYARLLEEMLLEPGEALRAALRLEAIGKDSIPVLEKSLKSSHALVRFCAAESLAYLGSTKGCDELARLAAEHPQLTAHCLLALAGMDEPLCQAKLSELLVSPNAELRCGAFQALRLNKEHDPRTQQAREETPFSLYPAVARQSPQLVYFSICKRPEIVLFGDPIKLKPPVKILAGPNFSVVAGPSDSSCIVTRYMRTQGTWRPEPCTLRVDDILGTMVKLGATYTDAVEFLRQADAAGCLPCALNANILPQLTPVETLAEKASDARFLERPVN